MSRWCSWTTPRQTAPPNGSKPRTAYASTTFPQVGGCILEPGLRWAFSKGAEHVLVVNNDVLLRPDTYRLLVADGSLFVTAVASDDPDCVKPVQQPSGRWDYAEPDPAGKRPHPTMSCFLIRRECWVKVDRSMRTSRELTGGLGLSHPLIQNRDHGLLYRFAVLPCG